MSYRDEKIEKLQHKFQEVYNKHSVQGLKAQGGIFIRKTRERLLGIQRRSGRGRKENDFWYDVRKYVKTSLIDLQLFIEVASEKNVNKVINVGSLEPILSMLLPTFYESKPTSNSAKIAQLLIEKGFAYLRFHNYTRRKIREEITEAIELSRDLTANLLPENERARAGF